MGDFLFGSKKPGKIEQVSTLTQGQRSLLDSLTGLLSSQLGRGVNSYGGTYTPGASDTQKTQYDFIQSLFDRSGTPTALSTLDSILKPYDKASATNWWEKSVRAPAMENWEEIKGKVLEPFAGMDMLDSGASRRALAEAGATMNTDITGKLADVLYQGEQGHLNRQLQGMNYPLNLVQTLNVPGATEREIASQQGQEGYQDWLMSQPWANPWLQQITPALGTRAFENVATAPTQTKGLLGEILGGASQLLPLAGKAFSWGSGLGYW